MSGEGVSKEETEMYRVTKETVEELTADRMILGFHEELRVIYFEVLRNDGKEFYFVLRPKQLKKWVNRLRYFSGVIRLDELVKEVKE